MRSATAPGPLLAAISVVIPSYNRDALLMETIERCRACAGSVELEFVVIDDGSRDDTPERLGRLAAEMPNLVWRSVPNGGAGAARNVGASIAKHEVLLFLGDDIQPTDEDFFRTHAELHAQHPERSFAVLGKVIWPNRPDSKVNFVMSHIQGRSGEQFGYADLNPYSVLDWRFFYTANVSIKRNLVDDWITEGFSPAFTRYGYEDGEFAYRMMKRSDPLRLLYVPTSVGTHLHPISAESFMDRQVAAGMMARVFMDLHDDGELPVLLGVEPIRRALATPPGPDDAAMAPDLLAIIEGVKAWVRFVECMQRIGSQWWHDELLRAVFALCYQQGFVFASGDPHANVASASWLIIRDFTRDMQRTVNTEILGLASDRWDVAGLFTVSGGSTPSPVMPRLPAGRNVLDKASRALRSLFLHGPHRTPTLRDWVKERPRVAALFRRVRRRLTGVV